MICKVSYDVSGEPEFDYFELCSTTDPVTAKSWIINRRFDGERTVEDKITIKAVEACRYVPRPGVVFKRLHTLVVDEGPGVNYYAKNVGS